MKGETIINNININDVVDNQWSQWRAPIMAKMLISDKYIPPLELIVTLFD